MKPIVAEADEATAAITFQNPEKRLASPLIQLEKAAAGYAPGAPT